MNVVHKLQHCPHCAAFLTDKELEVNECDGCSQTIIWNSKLDFQDFMYVEHPLLTDHLKDVVENKEVKITSEIDYNS